MNKIINIALLMVSVLWISGCQGSKTTEMVTQENFGSLDGKEVSLYTLTNKSGNVVKLSNFGAVIVEIDVPDRNGVKDNITFGYDDLNGYLGGDLYFGKVVGQYANRIAGGKFTLDGVEYNLDLNDNTNSLHGGNNGWHRKVWEAEVVKDATIPTVRFTYNKVDMEEGYPGNVVAQVTYTWNDANELRLDYKVTTDKNTVVNITNHAYFNLKGTTGGDILDHEVVIYASRFTPVDSNLIPTGELRPVEGTPFDFLTPHTVGERISDSYDQLLLGNGYDHNFVLDGNDRAIASAYHPTTGRFLEVFTDQPGVQFYTGNFLDGTQRGRGGVVYNFRNGLCFETQHFPDSPNQPAFPTVVVTPETPLVSYTTMKFSVK